MRHLKFQLLILITTFCFVSSSYVGAEDNTKAEDLVKHEGGFSNISNEELKQLMDDNVLVVDIRREEEWKDTGIIEGSKTITFFDKTGQVSKDFLPKFTAVAKKDQPVILICRSGVRTNAASRAIAQQLGYTNVINVTDGIMSWIGEKRPVSKYEK